MLLIVFAVVFLVVLFLVKKTSLFRNKEEQDNLSKQEGLAYSTETLADIINKDTDEDDVLDWEEGLWGTDPTKKETTPGIQDKVAIEKLKAQQEANGQATPGVDDQNLTQTEQFSRELFSTITALNQNGVMDQTTVDKLSNSLAESIQNSAPRKVFLLSDIKVEKDDSLQATKNFNNALNKIYQKNIVLKYTVIDVLQKFTADGDNPDVSVLSELDPIVEQISNNINAMIKIDVPPSLASLHLNVINAFEVVMENLNDMKLFETDVIVALGAISKYEQNATTLISAINKLTDTINNKLNN